MASLNFNKILQQLMMIQKEANSYNLLQFQSIMSGSQYTLLYQLCSKYLISDANVLDWGCGNGHFSFFLKSQDYKVSAYSFDGQPPVSEKMDSLEEYQYLPGDINFPVSIPFESEKFDMVSSIGVLEHVRETGGTEEQSLKEISRVLKPSGFFICYHFPNKYSHIELLSSLFPSKHSHLYKYTKQDIKQLCLNADFEVLDCQRYGFLPRGICNLLPSFISNSSLGVSIYDSVDKLLSMLFNPFCQNYFFIATKKSN